MGVQLNQLRKSLMYGVNVGCTGSCLGERLNGIQEVSGSIPLISTTQSSYSLNCKSFYYMQELKVRADFHLLPWIPVSELTGVFFWVF